MAKVKSVFTCSNCGYQISKWLGKCPECDEWNTLTEGVVVKQDSSASSTFFKGSGTLVELSQIKIDEKERFKTKFGELDQVLGGGLVRGQAILLSGDPGIGKSTLLMQIASDFSAKENGKVLYISGEESASQLKMRANRLKVNQSIDIYSGTNLDAVLQTIRKHHPRLLIVDSAQTLYSDEAGAVIGTTNQVKRCTHEIVAMCKELEIACFIVAHVTKDGSIAGPKALEHLVDTVLYFEEAESDLRVLRSVKNRFGAVDEVGLFKMGEQGLSEGLEDTLNALSNNQLPIGSSVAVTYEGSRVFFHEIQALTVDAKSSFSRVYSEKIDSIRVQRICAILEKHVGIKLSDQDIYLNVSGGIKLSEVGIDLPIALAIYSSRAGLNLPKSLVSAGEISLSGEIKKAHYMEKRVKSATDKKFMHVAGYLDDAKDILLKNKLLKECIIKILLI